LDNWQKLAEELVEVFVAPQGVADPKVLEALKRVPRHLFVPEEMRAYSYYDSPLAIGEGQTISQPFMVARMTELLSLEAGDKVLEIGTGSGYQAAVLAEIGMRVTTLERIEKLALKTQALFEELDYNITSILGDGREGYPGNAPYRGIIVTAGAQEIAPAWLSQLSEGGRIVVPLAVQEGLYRLLVRQKDTALKAGYLDTWYDYCRFVPLLPGVKKSGGA
jgi:protein-L-isoaspartate(D-aspartate) O-methyltransferase